MEQFGGGNPFLAIEESSVGEIFCPNSRLKFLPLRGPFMSWSAGRGSFRVQLPG